MYLGHVTNRDFEMHFFEFMNSDMSRLVTCLGLWHPLRLDFLNSNTCFYSRLYGISFTKIDIKFLPLHGPH